MKLTHLNSYTFKDQIKSNRATKFIGFGVKGSCTHQYAIDWGIKANTGEYTNTDTVFVSVNGGSKLTKENLQRTYDEMKKAIEAGATITTDDHPNRERLYNIGERKVAEYLVRAGYEETSGNGIWKKVA